MMSLEVLKIVVVKSTAEINHEVIAVPLDTTKMDLIIITIVVILVLNMKIETILGDNMTVEGITPVVLDGGIKKDMTQEAKAALG